MIEIFFVNLQRDKLNIDFAHALKSETLNCSNQKKRAYALR